MSDNKWRSVILQVTIQENGVIRNNKGFLIGRLSNIVGFESEYIQQCRASKQGDIQKPTYNTASMQCPFAIVERFADNGEHSHWELIDKNNGTVEWSQHA